jgi:hypothetical protein
MLHVFNKKILFLIACLLTGAPVHAQSDPDYRHITEAQYKQQTYSGDQSNLSQQYTFIGMYKQALMEEETGGGIFNLKKEQGQVVNAKNAYPFIIDAIKKNRIVILNETHNNPVNRVVFYNLIDSLEKLGVNSLFIEALAYDAADTSYENSKLANLKGYYLSENVFRQVMHKLEDSNLHIYSYEYSPKELDILKDRGETYIVSKNDTKWVPIKADNYVLSNFLSKDDFSQREAHQALKIFQKLNRENIDKAFIYCGYAHAWRQGNNMIDILEHLLQQKVYAIDQTALNERMIRKLEEPLYARFATTAYPFVLVDKQDSPCYELHFNTDTAHMQSLVDLVVASPRSVYLNNRPSWLELNGSRKRYPLSAFIDVTRYSDFLVAFYTMEELTCRTEDQIPDDVFQVFGGGTNYDAILKPNQRYQLRIIKNKAIVMDKTIHTN